MPFGSVLRGSPAVWLSPLLVALAVLATSSTTIALTLPEPYPLALTSAGASSVFLVAPVCAAWAAWEGGRLRRAGWFTLPHARSPIVIALVALAPALVVGLVAIAAAVAVRFLGAGAVALPDLRVVAKTVAVITAHALLGFAVGVNVPVVIAVPTVLLVDYGWMVLPIALEPLWLRHLNGTWISCCALHTDLAPQAFAGAVVVAAGFAATAVLLLRQPLDAARLALALAPLVLAFGTGGFLVHRLGPDPTVDRKATLVCSSGQPRVCVWPEHRGRLAEVAAVAVQADQAWRRFGIAVPAEFSEQRSALPPGTSSFGISLETPRSGIVASLAYSLLPPLPQCALTGTAPFPGGRARGYVVAWFADVAGLPRAELVRRFGPSILGTIDAVRSLPEDRQWAWLERNLAASGACGVPPRLEPGA